MNREQLLEQLLDNLFGPVVDLDETYRLAACLRQQPADDWNFVLEAREAEMLVKLREEGSTPRDIFAAGLYHLYKG